MVMMRMMTTITIMEIIMVMMMTMLILTLVIKKEVCVSQFTTPMSIYLNSYLAPRIGGIKQRNVLFFAVPQDDFVFYASEPRS